jgi:small-conductance mechanosensitive channel
MNSTPIIEELTRILSVIWDFILGIVPRLILGLFVLLIGYFVAKIVQSLVTRTIDYLNRNINNRLKPQLLQVDLDSSKTYIGKTIYWIIFIISVSLFTEILGLPVISLWLKGLSEYLPNILAGVIIIFSGIIFGRLVSDLVKNGALKAGISNSNALSKLTRYLILAIAIIIAIDQIGFDITFLTILIYILLATLLIGAALAFGIGAKSSVSNILASYYVNRTFKKGDVIRIGKHEGKIIKLTSTSILLKTDIGEVNIPAKEFHEKQSILID